MRNSGSSIEKSAAAADLRSMWQKAETHFGQRQWAQAIARYEEILAITPDDPRLLVQLSYSESLAGNYRAARDYALRSSRVPLRDASVVKEVLARLRTFNEIPALHGIIGKLLKDTPVQPDILLECARMLGSVNDSGMALRCVEAAMDAQPDNSAARLLHGQLLVHHGRFEDAIRAFEWVLARNPRDVMARWMLSRQRKASPEVNQIGELRKLLSPPGLLPRQFSTAARALHKELDEIGDYEGAWRALEMMCSAMRPTLRYVPLETRKIIDALVAWRSAAVPVVPEPGARTPVFIVGMHRSGTTLLEQLLDASPQVRGVGELYDFTSAMRYATDHHCKGVIDAVIVERAGKVDFGKVGMRYLDGLSWRLGEETHFTDKEPANFLNIGFICQALPQAKILHMTRDPVETCFSNLRELFSDANPYSYDQGELADYFLQYRRLMSHWHKTMPGRILDVDYSRLTSDPESVMREVATFCGIHYVEGMRSTSSSKRAVATASAVQVRDRVVKRDTPKWAPYAQHMRPLIQTLRAGGVEIDYPSA